jgi:hypothetical protein
MTKLQRAALDAAWYWANHHPRIASLDRYERRLANAVARLRRHKPRTSKP